VPGLLAELQRRSLPALSLHSAARGRAEYLRDPGLGRKLSAESAARLQSPATLQMEAAERPKSWDVAFIVADGLSALAVAGHAMPVIDAVLPQLAEAGWAIGPVCIVEQARVAIGDGIGAALGAQFSVVLIGERPGLSSPDSLGIYVTWEPRPGRTDAERNCISNVRPEGLAYDEAARRLMYLLNEGRRLGLTGVALKDGPESALPDPGAALGATRQRRVL